MTASTITWEGDHDEMKKTQDKGLHDDLMGV